MRKIVRRSISMVLMAGLFATTTVPSFAATSGDGADFELLADLVSEKQKLDEVYKKIGIDVDEVLKLPPRADFRQAAAQYYNELVPNAPVPRAAEPRTLEADRLAYAGKMAQWSKTRNPGVDLKNEALYMYISHYIDVPNPLAPSNGISNNSSNSVLAKYITNDDRKTYDFYVSKGSAKQASQSVTNAMLFVIQDHGAAVDTLGALVKTKGRVASLIKAGFEDPIAYRDYKGLKETVQLSYKSGKSVEDTVNLLTKQLASLGEPLIDSKTLAEQYIGLMFGPSLFTAELLVVSIYTELGYNLMDRANYYSMRMYYNFRWGERFELAYGF